MGYNRRDKLVDGPHQIGRLVPLLLEDLDLEVGVGGLHLLSVLRVAFDFVIESRDALVQRQDLLFVHLHFLEVDNLLANDGLGHI